MINYWQVKKFTQLQVYKIIKLTLIKKNFNNNENLLMFFSINSKLKVNMKSKLNK